MAKDALINAKVVGDLKKTNNGSGLALARDKIAQAYQGQWGNQATIDKVRRRIHWITSQVQGSRILDVGTSEGIVPILLGREGFQVVGIDINPEAIDYANSMLDQEAEAIRERVQFRNVSLFQGDTDLTFDTVIMGEVIEHVSNVENFVQKAVRHLAEEGTLIITTPFGVFPDRDHKHTFFLSDIRAYLSAHGQVEHLSVVDGYIRVVVRKRSGTEGHDDGGRAHLFSTETLLSLTEDASYAAQTKLWGQIETFANNADKLRHDLRDTQQAKAKIETRLQAETKALAAAEQALNLDRQKAIAAEEALLDETRQIDKLKTALAAREQDLQNARNETAEAQSREAALIAERHQQIDDMVMAQERLTLAESKLADAEAALAARSAEIEAARADLADSHDKLKSADKALAARDAKLAGAEAALAARSAEIEAAQADLADSHDKLKSADEALAARDVRLADAEAALAARSAEIAVAQADLAARSAEIEAAQDDLTDSHDKLKSADKALAARDAKLAGAEAGLKKVTAVSRQLKDQLDATKQKVDRLKRWQLVQDTGGTATDLALSRLADRLTRLSPMRRLSLTPKRIADLCVDVAKAEFADDKVGKLTLASLALTLDPKPWREKWLAVSLFKAGFGSAAARLLAGVTGRVAFSPTEQRIYETLVPPKARQGRSNTDLAENAPGKALAVATKQAPTPVASSGPLRVACIMDAFTRRAFAPEWTIEDLTPEGWATELDTFKPDFVFIESAWEGKDGAWSTEISGAKARLRALIAGCQARGLPVAFWNKEDPVHFSTFIEAARLADHVFTTDLDCVPRYRHALGHDRIFLLPFALQPRLDNPLTETDREDGFCFAGSYYLRYPERQRDFHTVVNTVKTIAPVTIYDRNFERKHRDYMFPAEYQQYIKGSLPPHDIHIAYKGYKYGINMNTVKQSQSMFARRVFELIGSGTITVSNFSRSVRNFFGDLTICTDDSGSMREALLALEAAPMRQRKLRLMALRKVLAEHTYTQRAAFVAEKVLNRARQNEGGASDLPIAVVAPVGTAAEAAAIHGAFQRQRHSRKSLHLVGPGASAGAAQGKGAHGWPDAQACIAALRGAEPALHVAVFHPGDWYGPHYLSDLIAARLYADDPVLAKAPWPAEDGEERSYRRVDRVPARRAVVRCDAIDDLALTQMLEDPGAAQIDIAPALCLDPFHYLLDGADRADADALVGDLPDINVGLSMTQDIEPAAETMRQRVQAVEMSAADMPRLTPATLLELLARSAPRALSLKVASGQLRVTSQLKSGKHAYLYATNAMPRGDLNLLHNSQIQLQLAAETALDVRVLFEFQDAKGAKISHNMPKAGGIHMLTIPHECAFIRLGLRVEGPGEAALGALLLGSSTPKPAALFCRTRYLIVTKQYPDYDDLYRYGFLHSRVRHYREAGFDVDVFRLSSEARHPFREFEGIDVMTGDADQLDDLLASGRIDKVMAHVLDTRMWGVLSKHIDRVPVTVWAHGSEIQHWRRRAFEFERLSAKEVRRQKKLSDQRMDFWRGVLNDPHPNLRLVFVSAYFAQSVMEDLGIQLPSSAYSVIHNPIDTDLFAYQPKEADHRKKILTIRPFVSRVYGNDLLPTVIQKLSKESFFEELSFLVIGDGELFDETVAPLRNYPNVEIRRGFIRQSEIAALHRDHGIALMPTRMDSQGVSRDEAMASGLVPVTNAVAAVPEFVDESCAMLAPAEDAAALADGIADLYRNPEKFKDMSAKAAARVRRQSSMTSVINAEISLVERDV